MKRLSTYLSIAIFLGFILLKSYGKTEYPTAPKEAKKYEAKQSLQKSGNCVTPPSGLVSWWPGDGNADDIQDGNNGTLQNGATFAAGMVGQTFSFDGVDDFVRVADAPNLRPAEITVDTWIFPESVSHQNINYFLSKGNHVGFTGPGGWSLGLGGTFDIPDCPGTNDAGELFVFNGLGPGSGAGNAVCYGTPLPLNTWTHVAFTSDGSTTKIYIDGQLVAQGVQIFPDNAGVDLSIGRRSDSFRFFRGKLDEVEIYNRALSAAEIQAIFNAGSAGKCKVVEIDLDIKPQSCPNPLNTSSKGVLPVAVLGSSRLDVNDIDVSTLQLKGVSPLRSSIADVATPVANKQDVCDCTTDGPDGFTDLELKFDTQDIVASLGAVNDGDEVTLTLTGNLNDGTPIKAEDCVVIIKK